VSTTRTYLIEGMTCGHCVSAVTGELTGLAGVLSVDIELVTGGASPVSVTSASPLRDSDVAAAIEEAGYALASASS
jgi:copper chaperone